MAERPDLSVKEARDYLIELNEARNEHLQSALAARRGNFEKKMSDFFDTLMLFFFEHIRSASKIKLSHYERSKNPEAIIIRSY